MTRGNPVVPTGNDRVSIFMQWVWEMLTKDLRILNSDTVTVDRTTRGIKLNVRIPAASTSTSSADQQVKVTAEGDDVLICNSWDGTTQGADQIIVAKPPELRKSVYDGKTTDDGVKFTYQSSNTRNATVGGRIYAEKIYPPYLAGKILYIKKPTGGTSVTYQGNAVIYEDSNDSARAWAFPFTACENGTARTILIVGREPLDP